MNEVSFRVLDAAPERYAASPMLNLRLRLEDSGTSRVESVALRCQIRIEPQRRRYGPAEEARLIELFGETPRWGDTLKPFLWAHVGCLVPGFRGATEIDLPVPCTYDMHVAAAKYFHALEEGEIPLLLLFSGTVFSRAREALTAMPIAWSREAYYRLPVAVWREVMDLHFPGGGWLRLRRETLDALVAVKARRALASWDEVIESLLRGTRSEAGPPAAPPVRPDTPDAPGRQRDH